MAVLLNLAHQARRPAAPRAAFRVLGVFADAEAARAHAARSLAGSDASLHLLPLRTWTPVMRDEEAPPEEALAHLQALGRHHEERQKAHAAEFASNVAQRRAGATLEEAPPREPDPPGCGAPVGDVPRDAEVRLQRFAVVSVIADEAEPDRDQQQPAVMVWAAFDSEEEARLHARETLGPTVTDVHLDVVAMYEWLFPTALDLSGVQEEYRDPRLDDLMRHHKGEQKRVDDFREQCAQKGLEAPVIDVAKPPEGPLCLPPSEPPVLAQAPEAAEEPGAPLPEAGALLATL